MIKKVIITVFALLYAGCAPKSHLKTTEPEVIKAYNKKVVSYEYKIQPGDRISILFFRHPELSTENADKNYRQERGILVSKNGFLILPLVGKVYVSGLTKNQLQEKLKQKYARYIKNPNIYIEVVNKRVYVLGEVKHPGVIHISDDRISLIEVLSKSGDITDYGEKEIYVIKGGLKNPVIFKVSLADIKSLSSSNLYLQPEDIVYVPPTRIKRMNLAINGALPLLNLIGGILSSFVDIKYLSQ